MQLQPRFRKLQRKAEREAVISLYNATGGPNWKKNGNWNTDADLSQWHGITTNDQGRVVKIYLFDNNLQGHIPEVVGTLGQLEGLYLSFNQLTGNIPRELGALSKLQELYLHCNQLSGPIPKELGSLRNLEQLWLQHNNLTGPMPKELGSLRFLEQLWLQHNKLTGTIPEELGNLTALTRLWLSNNRLEGHIPKELGALSKLEVLQLHINHLTDPIPPTTRPTAYGDLFTYYLFQKERCKVSAEVGAGCNVKPLAILLVTGAIPKELGDLRAITHLDLSGNKLNDAPNRQLTGGSLTLWQEKVRGARRKEPWAITLVDFLVSLWHFLLPIFDDVTDVILLLATFKDGRGLWWACFGAFVLADFERVLLLLVTFLLALCWIPFSLLGTNETRGKHFKVALKCLNGGHDLYLEPVFLWNDDRGLPVWGNLPSALRWPILDGFMWAVVGSRSKSSSLMSLWGMAGNTPVDVLEQSGFGLSLIDRIVDYHPYRFLGGALFSCPHRHHLPGSDITTRRSGVMLRAVGETLVVDSLFFALSLSTETWEDGVSIGILSLIFSVLELLTELQYYAAEARADMVTDGEEAGDAEGADRNSLELVHGAPSA